jgi:hypothetical protein
MSDVSERVAKAITDALQEHGDSDIKAGLAWLKPDQEAAIAAAAIKAMREPSAIQLRAATNAEHEHYWPGKSPTSHTWKSIPAMLVAKIWRAMIDAALS